MSLIPLRAGQSQGKATPQSRMNSGDSPGTTDKKSSALLTIQDVAAHCQVSYWTARGWIETGKLQVVRLPGRLIRIRGDVLERFVAGCER